MAEDYGNLIRKTLIMNDKNMTDKDKMVVIRNQFYAAMLFYIAI